MLTESTYSRYLSGKIDEQSLLEEIDKNMLTKLEEYLAQPHILKKKAEEIGKDLEAIITLDKKFVFLPERQFYVYKDSYEKTLKKAEELYNKYQQHKELTAKKDKTLLDRLTLWGSDKYADEKNWFPAGNAMMLPIGELSTFWNLLNGLLGNYIMIDSNVIKAMKQVAEWRKEGKKYLVTSYLLDNQLTTADRLAAYLHELGHAIDAENEKDADEVLNAANHARDLEAFSSGSFMSSMEERAWDKGLAAITNPELKKAVQRMRDHALNSYKQAELPQKISNLEKVMALLMITGGIAGMVILQKRLNY